MIPSRNPWNIPPCVCRLLAKAWHEGEARWVPRTDRELALITGWSLKKLQRIYHKANWGDITNADTDKFLWACGLELGKQRRYRYVVNRALDRGGLETMWHLRDGRLWRTNQIKVLLKMCERVLANEYQ